MDAARAAICAAEQDAFEAYHNLLFDPAVTLDDEPWVELAYRSGVTDTAAFHACVTKTDTLSMIAADTVAGNQLGLVGTPLFLINDLRVSGYPEPGIIERYVEQALRQAGSTTND